jgi:hypothetical protein
MNGAVAKSTIGEYRRFQAMLDNDVDALDQLLLGQIGSVPNRAAKSSPVPN